jgi:hypothetical protein
MSNPTEFLADPRQYLDAILSAVEEEQEEDDTEEEFFDKDEARYVEEDRLPKGAVSIASFSDEVENWTSWDLEAHVFVSPVPEQENSYALLILNWDDNWGRWDWEVPVALKNQKDASTAKDYLLEAFVKERYEPGSDSEWNQFVKSLDPAV